VLSVFDPVFVAKGLAALFLVAAGTYSSTWIERGRMPKILVKQIHRLAIRSNGADGFIPKSIDAFERYALRERLQEWTQESGESSARA
jgi:hypothetical protein